MSKPVLVYESQNAPVGESDRQVIRDAAAWQRLWAQLHAGLAPPPLPPVDFSREMVVFVTLGARSTGGFAVDVERVQSTAGGTEIGVVETAPGPGCMTPQVMTAPTVAVRVPATKGAVNWVVRRAATRC